MVGIHFGFVPLKTLTIGLIAAAGVSLSGCGSTGTSASLDDSTALSPSAPSATPLAKKPPKKNQNKTAGVSVGKAQIEGKAKTVTIPKTEPVTTAKTSMPPAPIRRTYLKTKRKKTAQQQSGKKSPVARSPMAKNQLIQRQQKRQATITVAKPRQPPKKLVKAPLQDTHLKTSQKTDKKTGIITGKALVKTPKPVVVQAQKEPVARKPVAKKPVAAEPGTGKTAQTPMVPTKAIAAQLMPMEAPQDIKDAFNSPVENEKPVAEEIKKAESVPIQHSFGETEHQFSGQ